MTERLERIEAILDRLAVGIEETKALANSNAKTIQAILENQETRRLEQQENAIGIEETKALANSNAKTIQAMLESQATHRIEHQEQALNIEETKALANSNAKTIQAMLESQATHRLEHQEQIERLDNLITRIASVQEGMGNWLVAIDDTQPTMLRRLNSIEDKINKLLERD